MFNDEYAYVIAKMEYSIYKDKVINNLNTISNR